MPTYEYYGFVLYLTSTVAFLVYILWAYLPAPVLHYVGIHYYYIRAQQSDGELAWTSPLWIEYAK